MKNVWPLLVTVYAPAAAWLLTLPAAAAPTFPHYTVTALGPVGDIGQLEYTSGWSINARGDVAWCDEEKQEAYLWSNGKRAEIGGIRRVAMRDDGKVVGLRPADPARSGYHQTTYHTVLWDGGSITDLGPTGVLVGDDLAINAQGKVVGSADSPDPGRPHGSHAILAANGGLTDLGTMGGRFGVATALNSKGQVVGFSAPAGVRDQRGFLWEKGKFRDLGTMPGFIDYAPNAINDRRQVAGWAFSFDDLKTHMSTGPDHAFLWEKGRMRDLGTLGGHDSHAYAVNNSGQVVGASLTKDGEQAAFLYQGGRMVDLNSLLPDLPPAPLSDVLSRHLTFALAINDRGQIVALGYNMGNVCHAFLLTPVGGPTAPKQSSAH